MHGTQRQAPATRSKRNTNACQPQDDHACDLTDCKGILPSVGMPGISPGNGMPGKKGGLCTVDLASERIWPGLGVHEECRLPSSYS